MLASVADKLKALMEERKVTAYSIAKGIGYTAPAVYMWVDGKTEPKTEAVKRLADYFKVPMEYFIDD